MNNKKISSDQPVNAQGGHILQLILEQKLKDARKKLAEEIDTDDQFRLGMLKGRTYGLNQALALVITHYSRTLFANPVQAPKITEELVAQQEKTIRGLQLENMRLKDGFAAENGGSELDSGLRRTIYGLLFNNTLSSSEKVTLLQERCRTWNKRG